MWLPKFGAAEGARELSGVTLMPSIQIVRNTERFWMYFIIYNW